MDRQTKQATLDGVFVPPMPKVRSSEGHIFDWDRSRIVAQIMKETRLVEEFYGYVGATREQAEEIARTVEERIRKLGLRALSGPLIREIVNMTLLEQGMVQYRNVCTRVGTPVYDAHLIDVGRGFEAHDNANLQENAETSHKKKADKISKEQYLLQLPPELADRHLAGDLHIHDLEYFGSRPFCLDGSTIVPVVSAGRHRTLRLDDVPFEGDEYFPSDLAVLTPRGSGPVRKITRRPVGEGEMLCVRTSSGKSVLATRDHRIPVLTGDTMTIKKAGEVQEGDRLYGLGETSALRGDAVSSIDLVRELGVTVPPETQETIFVRGARPLFDRAAEIEGSYAGISRALGIEHRKEWFTRGTMPLPTFRAFCEHYGLTDAGDLRIGVAGSRHELPAALPVTPALCRLLGFFVSEGNYDVVPGSTYNLAITENHQSGAIIADVRTVLGGYATLSGGEPEDAEIYGVRVMRDRAMQVYFGGKLGWLLFRYVFAVPEGAANKRLPWVVWHLDDELLGEFLSALFTGDGSAYYRPEKSDCIVNYTTASPSLRQELSLLLTSLGMHPGVVELYADDDERTTLYRLQLNGAENIRTFSRLARFLDDRQAHIDRFCAEVRPIASSRGVETVVSIGEAAPTGAYVYDLFLEGDGSEESHTFYASDGLLVHNCQDWDLRYFFYYGLMPDGNGTKASVAGPAKRAEVAVLHAVKALGSAQTNFAGGQGYYNFLTFMAPYFEGMAYDDIRQLMQMFVYEMTQMMVARGGQLVFSSVQLSPGVPSLWKDKPCVYKGKVWDGTQAPKRTYGEFEREVRLLFKAMMEVMLEGDSWGKPFSFPKPEISIEPDFMDEDEEFNRDHPDLPTYRDLYLLTFELASKFGTPYYDNQLPPYRGAGNGISCYQCLAGDELVPVVDQAGMLHVKQIADLYADAAQNGRMVDPNGTEFAPLPWSVPSVDLQTLSASRREFLGVMRKHYAGKILSVRLASGRRIRVTPDHPVYLLKDGAFVEAKARDLRAGHFVPVMKNVTDGLVSLEAIDLGSLLGPYTGAGIVIAEDRVTIRHAKYPGVLRSLPITPELARFLGYYLAEGCSDRSGRRWSVRLSFGKAEQALIDDAVACVEAIGFVPRISREKTATSVVVNSKLLFILMEALGAGKDAHSKSVPDLVFHFPPALIGEYIGAAFAGDGNVDVQEGEQGGRHHRAAGIRMKLVSRDAVQRLILLAGQIGVQMNYAEWSGSVTHPQSGEPYPITTYTCRITAQDQVERFVEATGFGAAALNPLRRATGGVFSRLPLESTAIGYEDLRYPSQYRSCGHRSVCRSLITAPSEKTLSFVEGDVHPLEVREVTEEAYDGYVYDLVEVEGTHTFAGALGIVTGNCCAYQFSATFDKDTEFEEKLFFRGGKHFSMGSWQVVSINCPRAAFRAEGDDQRLFAELKALMDVAVEVFTIKRRWMETIRTNGRMPFAMQRPKDPNTGERGQVAVDLTGLVYTIGVVGVNEMVQHHTGSQLHESKAAFRLAVRAMTELELYAREISQRTGMTIALARTPAETTGQRFAVADMLEDQFRTVALRVMKGDIETAVAECDTTRDLPVYYTNGTHVAPGAPVPLTKRMEIEHVFFPIVDGGNIFHIWLGEARPDPRGLMDMAMNLCKKTQIGYFAFTRDLTVSLKRYKDYHGGRKVPGHLEVDAPTEA